MPGLAGREMRKTFLSPKAMMCILWKAVCSETGQYSLGRGQRNRAARHLAGVLLHSEGRGWR